LGLDFADDAKNCRKMFLGCKDRPNDPDWCISAYIACMRNAAEANKVSVQLPYGDCQRVNQKCVVDPGDYTLAIKEIQSNVVPPFVKTVGLIGRTAKCANWNDTTAIPIGVAKLVTGTSGKNDPTEPEK
jgi:hypothetical protein